MRNRYFIIYIVLLVAQIVFANYLDLTQYAVLYFLPAMILCAPVTTGTVPLMLLAFLSGLAFNFFSDGMLGIVSCSLVPVALLRRPVVSLVIGSDVFNRKENLSIAQHGLSKISTVCVLCQAVFLLVFVILDSAGTRTFAFNAIKFGVSLVIGTLASLVVFRLFNPKDIRKWT